MSLTPRRLFFICFAAWFALVGLGFAGSLPAASENGGSSLYLANLRTSNGVKDSTAYGSATLRLSADEHFANIDLSFSNLTSAETSSYLRLSNEGEEGTYLVKIPFGQVSSAKWQIRATGNHTTDQIVAAIKAGKVNVVVATENNPSGELTGSFIASAGSQNFVAPPAPPNLPATTPTAAEASRFLAQATFGPTKASIDDVIAKGYAAWIDEQITLPASSHRVATKMDFDAFNTNEEVKKPNGQNRQAAWWNIAVTGKDQLRQRVAFAFSELFVISDENGKVKNWQEGAANYYDLLAKDGLGNFRTLLEDVTLSPMMGVYLSHVRNSKATATTEPDENYAREVMQLFTVGLNQLQPDGTLKLDASGAAIPTYDQKTVSETARVFTGWQFNTPKPNRNNFRGGGGELEDYIEPMTLNPLFHDDGPKTIIGGLTLPAAQGGAKDLKDTLDALFNHPNTPPFVARHLIQRLVTSNPSPGYIYRVAQVFADNGSGVRGDLAAVVKAVLLDYEARSPQVAASQTFGKLKEPLLRVTALLRAFNGAAGNGRYNIFNAESTLAQAPLRSPTVFNFFEPNYVVPGPLAQAGLYAPERQILTDTTAISIANTLFTYINAKPDDTTISLDYSGLPSPKSPSELVDQLNILLCAGSMPAATQERIVSALKAMPASATDTDRYRSAIYLTVTTQSAAVQK
ncbi:MAG TPA: DUF1800 family protein [Opitutaceae bacterium]|nr:DUF1800 family protein [Opitutaceae bacterium]